MFFKVVVFFTVVLICAAGFCDDLEKIAVFLRDKKVTVDILEKQYSCRPLSVTIESGMKEVKDIEAAVKSARQNTRIAGLLPTLTAWGKYSSDDKLYLYQQNNIAVGSDYITVGPDDNNKTIGNINAFEVGAKLEFNLSKLLYNTDTLKFTEEQQKLYYFKVELIDRITYAYYYIAVVKAVKATGTEVPVEIMMPVEIAAKKLEQWFKSITNLSLSECSENEQK